MVSPAQTKVRNAFKDCVNCFNNQPESGGVTPPDIGPRNRSWWYSQAGGMWYYNYFIKESWNLFYSDTVPDWCRSVNYDQGTLNGYSKRGGAYYENFSTATAYLGVKNNHYPGGDTAEKSLWVLDISSVTEEDINKCSDVIWKVTLIRGKLQSGGINNAPLDCYFSSYPYDYGGLPANYDEVGGGDFIHSVSLPIVLADTVFVQAISIKNIIAQALALSYSYIIIHATTNHQGWNSGPEFAYSKGVTAGAYKCYFFIQW